MAEIYSIEKRAMDRNRLRGARRGRPHENVKCLVEAHSFVEGAQDDELKLSHFIEKQR